MKGRVCGLIWGIVLAFPRGTEENNKNISIVITNLHAKIEPWTS
jgi:hypothetical protein